MPGGSIPTPKRLGKLARKVNLDHTPLDEVVVNLGKTSKASRQRAVVMYRRAKKKHVNDEDIDSVLQHLKKLQKKDRRLVSRVKRVVYI